MSSAVETASMQTLSQIVEALGPISQNTFDKWSGKRGHRRRDVLLPVRLRLLNESEKPGGPAFTARSRDVSDQGLGLTIPCKLSPRQRFAVEVFTDMGTWMGRMQLIHCTQTIGGYKVGLQCAPGALSPSAAPAQEREPVDDDQQSDILTVEQARAEVIQALRRYQLAEVTWGLFGVQMDREIKRILDSLPPPLESRLKLEPRRSDYRHEVEGDVHVLVPGETGPQLVTTRIADLSAGGARVMLRPEQADAQWRSGSTAAIGIWTVNHGTLWLPTRIVHGGSPLIEDKSVGLQFVREASVQDFR